MNPPHVSNTVTVHHQKAVTVYAAYGIYRAENMLKCVKLLIYILNILNTLKFLKLPIYII